MKPSRIHATIKARFGDQDEYLGEIFEFLLFSILHYATVALGMVAIEVVLRKLLVIKHATINIGLASPQNV